LSHLLKLSIFVIFLICGKSLFAEQQGVLDENESEGQIEIELNISELAQISNLDDFYFDNWDKKSDMQKSDDVCVYSNGAGGRYNIIARGTGANGNFEVTDSVNSVPYEVYWNDDINKRDAGRRLRPNRSVRRSRASNEYFDCNGINNASLTIRFLKRDLASALTSSYHGTLIVSVSPI